VARRRQIHAVLGVAGAALAVSLAIPALRSTVAQDAPGGSSQPAVIILPELPAAALPAPRIAQLPAVELPASAPADTAPAAPAASAAPAADSPTLPEPAPAPAPAATPAAPAETVSEERFQLRTLTADQLHARIEQIFGRPAPLLQADGSAWTRFTVQMGADAPVLIAVLPPTGEVRLLGRPDQLRAWRELLAAVDAPPAADRTTEVVAAETKAAPQIRKTVDLLLAQAQVPAGPGGVQGPLPGIPEGLLGPVEIVNIQGTDLFIIQGNPRDVERALQIIQQIQEMSRVSEPQIVVRPLKNVDAGAMSALLAQLFAPATDEGGYTIGGYYGRLLSLPLGRPNAVLLVGAPGTVAKAQEILDQLDVPSASPTQFEVFRLRHARAETAQPIVEQMFTIAETGTPAAFGPRAFVIAEPRTNALIVRAAPSDMDEVRQLVTQIDQPGGEKVNEIRVFKLQHSLASVLAPVLQNAALGKGTGTTEQTTTEGLATLLRMVTIDPQGRQQLESGVLAGVTVNADTRANALIVSAPPESMPLMALLIEQLDQLPAATAELKVFTLTNGDAVTLGDMLRELFGAPQTGGGAGGGAGTAPNSDVFQLRFSVDERTNSIIAAGSADELLVVEAIIRRLDGGESRSRVNRVYRLKNAFAGDVALALQDWLDRKRQVEQTAPGVVSPFAQIEREVVVVAEIGSNSLIVSATPAYYQELEQIISQLDEQAPMVMIQVLIGEVRLSDADEFGVEFGLQDSVLFDRSNLANAINITNSTQQTTQNGVTTVTQQVVQSADLTPGYNFGNPGLGLPNSGSDRSLATAAAVGAQGLSSFAVNRVSPDLGFGGFVLSASSQSVSMLLRALQETRRLEVLSRPQIMALDNQPGRAFVGQIVPVILGSTISANVGITNNVVQQPVGLELIVTPRISPEDLVVMNVSAMKRELGPVDQGVPVAVGNTGEPVLAPIINSTEAQTTVSAASGQTVVLSGLLTKRDEALHRRVPLLADIPLVGALFRFDSSRQVRTELLIVLTPHVIRGRADADRIKQIESARMSWCLADVVDLHGPAGLRSRTDRIGAAEAEVIYPTVDPGDIPRLDPGDQTEPIVPTLAPPDAGRYQDPGAPPAPAFEPTPQPMFNPPTPSPTRSPGR
jgi:type II secretion system protein D